MIGANLRGIMWKNKKTAYKQLYSRARKMAKFWNSYGVHPYSMDRQFLGMYGGGIYDLPFPVVLAVWESVVDRRASWMAINFAKHQHSIL